MKVIPTTKLRNFYESLGELGFSTETQSSILKDFNRKNKYDRLIKYYLESKKHFAKYENIDEDFLPENNNHRKNLPKKVQTISKDIEAVSVLAHKDYKIDDAALDYRFLYIERQVPVCRTTRGITEEGVMGKSGSGGIDFIGFNINNKKPILGEIKVGGDENAFYALIQLMTYLSEISTPNQINRLNNWDLFKNGVKFTQKTSFYLYILLISQNIGLEKTEILNETKKLANKLEKEIQEIEEVVFLQMHTKTKIIKLI